MKRLGLFLVAIVLSFAAFLAGYLVSKTAKPDLPYAMPTHTLDGSVNVPAFNLPPSDYMSEAALDMLKMRAVMPPMSRDMSGDINERRAELDKMMTSVVSATRDKYPVTIEESSVAGIPVRVFTPLDGSVDPNRVLINLHGGAFSLCWDSCSILESAPIASVAGMKVISVNYRMAPEYKHPAGVEDAVAVYEALLKQYAAQSIGVYGCSAGGMLTAQTAAKITLDGLARPGAIGIFGAGGVPFTSGDSAYVAAYIDGSFPPPAKEGEERMDLTRGYFDAVDFTDPIVSPGLHEDVLAQFPPTLITTGTRAADLSPAVYTNSQLIKAGVDSRLIVGEAMGHCYQYFVDLPESRIVYDATSAFFKQHLQ